jgi:hypothetical protein
LAFKHLDFICHLDFEIWNLSKATTKIGRWKMKTILSPRRDRHLAKVCVFLITVALIAGMAGCSLFPSQNLEIQTWYDLDAVRNNLAGNYILMNDLNSTTAGYEELASPTANEGKGWHPIIGTGGDPPFTGTFDGQGYEIRDLFINLPGIGYVGLFSIVGEGGVVQNVGVMNGNVTSTAYIGGLVGVNFGTVSNSYFTGSVSSINWAGGLVGFNSEGATVSNSYSTGSVSSEYGVGGLVGANNGTVSNSYSTGSVSASGDVGGLVGYSEGTVSNSFWDVQTSGQVTSAGGTGKTTAEMKDIATFTGAGWNIVAVGSLGDRNPSYIWNIVTGQIYPFLSWQP